MHLKVVRNIRGLVMGQRLTMDRYFGRALVAHGIAEEVLEGEQPRKKRAYKRRDLQAEQSRE
jgi:hypothetical protein